MHISSLLPVVNTAKLQQPKRGQVAVAGAKVNKDAAQKTTARKQCQRRGQERRQRNIKPLVDLRSGSDRRRNNPDKPSVSLNV